MSSEEEGEILEIGEVQEAPIAPPSSASLTQAPLVDSGSLKAPPLPPVPPPNEAAPGANDYDATYVPRKRPHTMIEPPSSQPNMRYQHQQQGQFAAYQQYPQAGYHGRSSNHQQPPMPSAPPRKQQPSQVTAYNPDLIVQFPRQSPSSQVLLDFDTWMESMTQRRTRLHAEDIQSIVTGSLLDSNGGEEEEKGRISPYLMPSLCPNKPLPRKVCVVLLSNFHPSVLQKYRKDLSFFDNCTSMPCTLMKKDQAKRVETPLPELIYRYPKPSVHVNDKSVDELFYAHELTFLFVHSYGYTDELILRPQGTFTRKSQPLGGTWQVDGDLLHLKWQKLVSGSKGEGAVVAEENDEDYTLDVLQSEDRSMRYFTTDPQLDLQYAKETPEHLASKQQIAGTSKPRSIRLSLVKATAVDVARDADGAIIRTTPDVTTSVDEDKEVDLKDRKTFEYFILSMDELKQHGFPVDVKVEQQALNTSTRNYTMDKFVETQARPDTSAADVVYAIDCEMCETDLGMELTRVTVVDALGRVAYDQLVKPHSTILNYHTEYSGITPEMLETATHTLADVQRDLTTEYLFSDTILVGHSLSSDLRALRLVHVTIADTSILYPHQRGFPFRPSLKYLTKTYLQKDIQTKLQDGHDSAEDAIAAMELLLRKVRRGPSYGIPETSFVSSAFDALPSKLEEDGKKMTLLKYQYTSTEESGNQRVGGKPWQRYSHGDLRAHTQSPFVHATKMVGGTVSNVEECSSLQALETKVVSSLQKEDLCWVEVDGESSFDLSTQFIQDHVSWMTRQKTFATTVNDFLTKVQEQVKDVLTVVVPQSDLAMLAYLRGLRTRSKWKDEQSPWTPDMQEASNDAFRGAMDSCVFLSQN